VTVDELQSTRRSLHGVAELVLAGPQFSRSGTIHLRASDGGFSTVAEPDVRVDGTDLVSGTLRLAIDGATPQELAERLSMVAGAPGMYSDGGDVTADEPLRVEASAAAELALAFATGQVALTELAPAETPVLWPEHFDIAISVGRVNFGVSPGDALQPLPYAYVGPWDRARALGAFWNAPFGAVRTLRELGGTEAVVAFFREGAALADAAD
jgi:hypothetical protein